MASIPSSGSLMATHNYYRSKDGCWGGLGALQAQGDVAAAGMKLSDDTHKRSLLGKGGLPKSDPGHWWASFFFGKVTHPAMTTVSESQESLGALQLTTGPVACGLEPGAGRRRHMSEPSSGPSA
uniref:Uncharacterized protein n=1 Tax=Melopsittacus undulatus TaxID=13146 RepID=A0A8V5GCG8_MELUD